MVWWYGDGGVGVGGMVDVSMHLWLSSGQSRYNKNTNFEGAFHRWVNLIDGNVGGGVGGG